MLPDRATWCPGEPAPFVGIGCLCSCRWVVAFFYVGILFSSIVSRDISTTQVLPIGTFQSRGRRISGGFADRLKAETRSVRPTPGSPVADGRVSLRTCTCTSRNSYVCICARVRRVIASRPVMSAETRREEKRPFIYLNGSLVDLLSTRTRTESHSHISFLNYLAVSWRERSLGLLLLKHGTRPPSHACVCLYQAFEVHSYVALVQTVGEMETFRGHVGCACRAATHCTITLQQ